ncbi:MAG TPA: hypothetical protein VF199_04535 [Bacillales bacterium]
MDKRSPLTALLWSFAAAGLGQLYNRDYIIAFALLGWEAILNLMSHLNRSLFYTFQGKFIHAHDVVNYEWGVFYPSIWAFSMWQAYNCARNKKEGGTSKKPELTGLFLGAVVGMNTGVMFPLSVTSYIGIQMFFSPVISGTSIRILGAFLGYQTEKWIKK